MDYFEREKKKETIFDRLTMTEAVVVVVILINSTVVGLFVMYYLPVSGLDLIGFEPYRQAHESHSVPKTDSDMINISGTMIKWPDKLSDMEEEYVYGTDWRDPDTDKDGMEDGWEVHYSTRREWIYSMQYPDPLIADPFDNYDGDGFDGDRNGLIEDEEALFNLREYCGGALFDMEEGAFVSTEPIFGGLDPAEDWREIGMKGGYHLFDSPSDGIVGDPDDPDDGNYDDYFWYDPENERFPPPTTDPSTPDTDGDGMEDGWEIHYARVMKEYYYDAYQSAIFDIEIIFPEPDTPDIGPPGSLTIIKGLLNPYQWLVHPIWKWDAQMDIDLRRVRAVTGGELVDIMVLCPDGLSNLEEFQAGTNPFLWDSDDDSYLDPYEGGLFELDDRTEVRMEYLDTGLWNWKWDCPYPFEDYRLDPMDPDTDGDGMPDGWELAMGLNPLNGTDHLKDLDNDGLPNYLEYAFPNLDDVWFRTDPKNPDTDGDGMPDGWEAYNSKIIAQNPATSERDDLEDKIPDGKRTVFTVSPMIPDADDDNDGYWETDEWGNEIYCRRDDGVTNIEEYLGSKYYPRSSDPSDADSDDDGLYDGEEMKYGFPGELIGGKFVTDPDIASRYYTNHNAPDTDLDRWGCSVNVSRILTDWEEVHGRTREVQPRNSFDDDGDGEVDEYDEYLFFSPTNASNPDSDLDGLMDVDEVFGIDTKWFWELSDLGNIRTDPTKADSDSDGLNDFFELHPIPYVRSYNTNPLDPDTDRDGMTDWHEWTTDFFPLIDWDRSDDPDWLYEKMIDWEWDYGIYFVDRTDPNDPDTDNDGMSDGWEFRNGYLTYTKENKTLIMEYFDLNDDIYRYCNDVMPHMAPGTKFWIVNPLLNDAFDDPDRDGLTNFEEYQQKTHPLKADTDGDGMPDGWELDPENRGQPAYDPWSRRYRYTLDPLNPNDWYLDPDHDGVILYQWTPSPYLHGRYYNETFYFPWVNLYEYMFGEDLDGDGINDLTTSCAPRLADRHILGGYDSDSDGTPDGYEIFWNDEDNDTLPSGWELFYNGTLWNTPETRPYKDPGLDWNPFTTSLNSHGPFLTIANVNLTKGKLFHERSDSNVDGVPDDLEDWDDDLHLNGQEMDFGTDPTDIHSYPYSPALLMSDSRRSY